MSSPKLKFIIVVLASLALGGCSRDEPEVLLQRSASSPDGRYEARVEMHVYGPHFGGETPSIEVHVTAPGTSSSDADLVLSTLDENATVSVLWLSPSLLQVSYPMKAKGVESKQDLGPVRINFKAH